MDFNELVIDNLGQINLSQKKFNEGSFIATGLKDGTDYVAIDIRFYIEKEEGWLPTRNGFWVAKENWAGFKNTLSENPEDIGEVECWKNKYRKFIIRYSPEYGGGIDFRYYCESAKYTGWEKKGIRIMQRDYAKVKNLIFDALKRQRGVSQLGAIKVIKTERAKRHYKSNEKSTDHCHNYKNINPALMEILGG